MYRLPRSRRALVPTPSTRPAARTEPRCPGVLVALEIPTDVNVARALASCTLKTGSIRITAWTSARATGEFSGAGVCLTRDGRTLDGFRVANGRFDVALTEVVHLWAGAARPPRPDPTSGAHAGVLMATSTTPCRHDVPHVPLPGLARLADPM